jgi:hypothetical protein
MLSNTNSERPFHAQFDTLFKPVRHLHGATQVLGVSESQIAGAHPLIFRL